MMNSKERAWRLAASTTSLLLQSNTPRRLKTWAWNSIAEKTPHRIHGKMEARFFGNRADVDLKDLLQRYLFYFGVWEPCITRYISRNLAEDSVFVDVGANIGYYSLLSSGLCRNVVAIEASPRIFKKLQKTIEVNSIDNVRLVNKAVGASSGVAKIYSGPPGNSGATTMLEDRAHRRNRTFEADVETAPISTILTKEEMAKASLIKINVEGMERSVLDSIFNNLEMCSSELEIIFEASPGENVVGDRSFSKILDDFRQTGYNAFEIPNSYSAKSYISASCERIAHLELQHTKTCDLLLTRRGLGDLNY